MGQLQKIEQQLIDLGYQLIAITPDHPGKLNPTIDKGSLKYKLLSDSSGKAMTAFGISFRVSDETFELYKNRFNLDLEEHSGAKHHLLPVPAVFLTGKDGKILFQYVNPDYRLRLPAEVLLAAAQAWVGK